MRRGLQVLMAVMLATLACAQTMDPPPPASRPEEESLRKFGSREMFENMGKLLNGLEGLGPWDQHHKYFMSAVTSVYEKNGWDSESDRFSLDLIREVESKPPMAIQERFDTMVGMFSDRYMLDENQERDLRSTVMNESLQVFAKHSGRIMSYALEAIQTRASGEAFTSEQVARWAQLAEPVFNDGRERMVVAAKAFMEKLDPQQRQLVERDLEAATQRLDRVHEMGERWARGEWDASDWGLDNDPIQRAGEARASQTAGAAAAGAKGASGGSATDGKKPAASSGTTPGGAKAEAQPQPVGGEAGGGGGQPVGGTPAGKPGAANPAAGAPAARDANDPWARYVIAFIAKYKLNQEQGQRAWLIYDEVKPRVDQTIKRYGERPPGTEEAAKQTSRRDSEIERLFAQMSRRMDRIPTSQQRREAGSGDLPSPIGSPAATPEKKPAPAAAPASRKK